MKTISKIIITGDILRPNGNRPGNQDSNIIWFYYLFEYFISCVLPKVPVEVMRSDSGGEPFRPDTFFNLNAMEMSTDAWAKLYDSEDISPDAAQYFSTRFQNALVLGYELPPVFLTLMNSFDIPYIDFSLHPCRFLDDVFFSIHSNNTVANRKLSGYAMNNHEFYKYASFHKAGISRMPNLHFDRNSALIVGQTEIDRSLINKGRIFQLWDYKETIKDIAEKYSTTYFKPHPYAANIQTQISFLNKYDIQPVDSNIYRCLCNDNLTHVYSISSSVIEESKYFGKNSTRFMDTIHLEATPVINHYFDTEFWAEILGCFFDIPELPHVHLPNQNSRLRDSLGLYWGYHIFGAEKINYDLNKESLSKINNLYNIAKNSGILKSYNCIDRFVLKFNNFFSNKNNKS